MNSNTNINPEQKGNLINLIKKANVYDSTNRFLNLDFLWASPTYLIETADILRSILETIPDINSDTKIVGLDTAVLPFGIIPILSFLSASINLDLLIWKEAANRLTGQSVVYPDRATIADKDKAIIIQDVTVKGMAPIKAAVELARKHFRIVLILSLIDTESGAKEYIEDSVNKFTDQVVKFESILTLTEIANSLG